MKPRRRYSRKFRPENIAHAGGEWSWPPFAEEEGAPVDPRRRTQAPAQYERGSLVGREPEGGRRHVAAAHRRRTRAGRFRRRRRCGELDKAARPRAGPSPHAPLSRRAPAGRTMAQSSPARPRAENSASPCRCSRRSLRRDELSLGKSFGCGRTELAGAPQGN